MPQQYKIDKVAEIGVLHRANAGLFCRFLQRPDRYAGSGAPSRFASGAQMKVYKNNLAKIAPQNQEQPEMVSFSLAGPSGNVFTRPGPWRPLRPQDVRRESGRP